MGVAADGSNKAFPSKDVDAFLDKPRAQIPVDIMGELSRYNTRHFVLAVDPAGGGASAFAVSSMVQISTGQIIVRCYSQRPHMANSQAARPPTSLIAHTPARQTSRGSGTSSARIVGE